MSAEDETIHIVVRRPLADIEGEIRKRHRVTTPLIDVAVEQDSLVLTFQARSEGTTPSPSAPPGLSAQGLPAAVKDVQSRTRRRRRVRNRMRTRGWPVVGKFVNGRGQTCTVYKPIIDALQSGKLRRREASTAVRQLLISNGNTPGLSSVEYFLDNHLEYIEKNLKTAPKAE
jgi:hypothetical protein